MRSTATPLVLAVLLLPTLTPRAAAQVPQPLPLPEAASAVSPAVPLTLPAPGEVQSFQALRPRPLPAAFLPDPDPRRVPVLDDAGNPIALGEIEARVDRSGGWGLAFGALGGALIGGLAAILANEMVACGTAQGLFGPYDRCSPQEQALRDTFGWTAFLTGVVAGMSIGWSVDVVTWQEALTRIRAERAAAGGTP